MARTDAIVLGAGIVGTCVALHLVKRGVSVALVDRGGPGDQTSYGNAGIIGSRVYPAAFPSSLRDLARIALKRAPEANYHLRFLPRVLGWLGAFRAASSPERLAQTARLIRPLLARAVAEHEALMADSGSRRYLRKEGWLSLYRSERAVRELRDELALALDLGVAVRNLDLEETRALEPELAPVFRASVHWLDAASISNPFAVTQAYALHFEDLGGALLKGDARSLHRAVGRWRVETEDGRVDADHVVVALGAWSPDVLTPRSIRLPLAVKRGYHLHFRPLGRARLTRPIVDVEKGYVVAPMTQGMRITTGVEFADRDARPTPVQFKRLLPIARNLLPLGEQIEAKPWMGNRPCFADSLPVIGRAPGHPGLWLAFGHGHIGMSLGPVTGRLLAEMMVGQTPFCDPSPYRAERFAS